MNDSDIIELYFARSDDAIAETDKKYGGCCRSTAYNILGNHEDSEECVNDTYLKVWNVIPPTRPGRLGAFVIRIARNLAVDMCKKRGRLRNGGGYSTVSFDEVSEFLPSANTVESAVNRQTFLKAVEKFLFSLPKAKRVMFVQRYFYCCTYGEIAKEMHLTEENVTAAVHRTREKLRRYLEKEGIEI